MIEVLGWFGALLLALSSVPQLVKTIQTKRVEGLSFVMLFSWWLGCGLMFVYVASTSKSLPVLGSYTLTIVITSIIMYFYFKYRNV